MSVENIETPATIGQCGGMQRIELPARLAGAFSTADATRAGVSRSRLRAADLVHPFHGVYGRRLDDGTTVSDLIAARAEDAGRAAGRAELDVLAAARQYSARMGSGEFFVRAASAAIWGLPLPPHVVAPEPLDVAVFSPHRAPRARGIRGHEVMPFLASLREHPATGLRVSSVASTWAMLAAVLEQPYDLIAFADAAISDRRVGVPAPLATRRQLRAAVSAGRRVGVAALRDALDRVRPHVASRTETWTRLTLVDGRLPEPETSFSIFDADGTFVACVDLAYPAQKVAIEYEGLHHLFDERQWLSDIDRYERLAEAGWRVIRVTKVELFQHPHALVERVGRAIESAR